ncbi:hypothetical protein BGZ61DRAFT_533137 [Ilyonectria robusta]|uniref:uncharacterized protein n=1 Tax=Ilyonectria robusta TaxID=1079257 RepID=UPI001E8EA6DE|nr:uncharacterized protein BGZ61DRAFT_533137 [Ilyonectria robusta]KAH8688353.1 hypothetical protein BGZ61DRAFT_533137 [Ilyonectria robusta]
MDHNIHRKALPYDQGSEEKDVDKSVDKNVWDAPPPYELHLEGSVLTSSAAITDAGTIDISFSSKHPDELNALLPALPESASAPSPADPAQCPPLNIVIQVVGSRGDVQPFIALGNALQRRNHRVRIATHNTFADFVTKSGLEFYPIGGDPEDLINPGLIPSLESLRGGDISRKRKMIHEMLQGCWKACVEPDPISGESFVADAIIANPPSFAHVHCAQALGIPVHIMFTMPWTATRAFPHPLANLKVDSMNAKASNYLSYGVVDLMTWQGLGDVINGWRAHDLQLEPLSATMGPDILSILQVPYTYCWSPALVPKPSDWGSNIDICGFFMRDEPAFQPPEDLANFLALGPPPIYVGFGSIVIQDPKAYTEIILESCRRAGVRVIISRGWSKLGGNSPNTDDVFYLGDCPHEWLFKRVSAVVHHGGAGTTACGLSNARPTIIVPFFGDQPFWGGVVASNGAGPNPIPHKSLNVDNLTAGIQFALSKDAQVAAQGIASRMLQENGVEAAVNFFHSHLPPSSMTCDLLPTRVARWTYAGKSKTTMKLSDVALKVLLREKKLKRSDIEPFRPREYDTDVQRWDPLTAGASSTLGTITNFTASLGGTFIDPYKEYKRVRSTGGNHAGLSAAGAAGKGFVGMGGAVTKGMLVDVPLALTEGLRNTPRLYGDHVEDHGKVKDWKSGGVVAAKSFGSGFYHGITGVVTKPMEGAKAEGTIGLLKGVGKGSLGLITKPGSAMFGLLAYPAEGIYKSIKTATSGAVKRAIEKGRAAPLESAKVDGPELSMILNGFAAKKT